MIMFKKRVLLRKNKDRMDRISMRPILLNSASLRSNCLTLLLAKVR